MKRARHPAAFAFATLAYLGSPRVLCAAGPDPAAETQRLLKLVDTPATHSVVQDPVSQAKAAQQRADSARGAGDLLHSTELQALALTWAQVADDLVRAAAAESKLAEVQKAVADLEQKSVRTQALIEQTIARKGRAEQNLASLGTPPAPVAPSKTPVAKASTKKPMGGAAPSEPRTQAVKR